MEAEAYGHNLLATTFLHIKHIIIIVGRDPQTQAYHKTHVPCITPPVIRVSCVPATYQSHQRRVKRLAGQLQLGPVRYRS